MPPPPAGFGCHHEIGRAARITVDGRDLFGYVYRPDDAQRESPRPYLHPVRTLGGDLVTIYRPHDHVWHKGLAWSLPHVGPDNFWGGRTFTRGEGYVQRDNNGSMDHEELLGLEVSADHAHLRHRLAWRTQQGRHLVEEERTLTARLTPGCGSWTLVFDTVMDNVSGATIQLGSPTTAGRENAGYGGLLWRGPRSFTGGTIHTPDGSGADELRGTRAEWMGFTGWHDEEPRASTLVVVDDTVNPRHPPQWFVRSAVFPALCPAPFFSAELAFEPGRPLRFRYAVVVADGDGDDGRAAALAAAGRDALRLAGTGR